jgi:predicted P-loop ATPase
LTVTNIPEFLTGLDRWLLWREVSRDDKRTKIPFSARGGEASDVTAPANWGTYEFCTGALVRAKRAWDGTGIVLGNLGNGEALIGLDLDACIHDDAIDEWAVPFLTLIPTYAEVSPSGSGLKLFFRVMAADLADVRRMFCIDDDKNGRKRTFGVKNGGGHAPGAEIYLSHRYFTVTGNQWPTAPDDIAIMSCGELRYVADLFGPRETGIAGSDEVEDLTAPDPGELEVKLTAAICDRPQLAARWYGSTAGLSDATRSGFDMSLGSLLKAAAFSYGEMRAALILNEHGKGAEAVKAGDERYFLRIWMRSVVKARQAPEPPPAEIDDPGYWEAVDAAAPLREPTPTAQVTEAPPAGNVVPLRKPKPTRPRPDGWKAEWHLTDTGAPLPTLYNAMVALRNHPPFVGLVRYDDMARSTILAAKVPGASDDTTVPRQMRDADVIAMQEELQRLGLRRVGKPTVQDALDLYADQARFHPVRDYLSGLTWDGEQRVTGWLSRYLGVEGGAYADTIGRLFMIGLVARIFEPGCKADYMPILEGPQGALKSSACRVLAGGWFSDNLPDLSRGDAVRISMHLRGKWLIEIGELSSFSSAEAHTLKEFLTQTEERYTPKFARNEVYEPRQCLFIGTTNETAYLRDDTGARRFWPVKVGEVLLDDLAQARDQLFAEAVTLYRSGEHWWPERAFEAEHIAPQQAARHEPDPWEEAIKVWLDGGAAALNQFGDPVVDEWGAMVRIPPVDRCTVTQVLLGPLKVATDRLSVRDQRRVSGILTRLGWQQIRSKTARWFVRPI